MHTGQVEEIWILMIVVENMSCAEYNIRCSNYCYRVGRQLCRELRSSLCVFECSDAWCDWTVGCQWNIPFSAIRIVSTFTGLKQVWMGLMERLSETKLGSINTSMG